MIGHAREVTSAEKPGAEESQKLQQQVHSNVSLLAFHGTQQRKKIKRIGQDFALHVVALGTEHWMPLQCRGGSLWANSAIANCLPVDASEVHGLLGICHEGAVCVDVGDEEKMRAGVGLGSGDGLGGVLDGQIWSDGDRNRLQTRLGVIRSMAKRQARNDSHSLTWHMDDRDRGGKDSKKGRKEQQWVTVEGAIP